MVTKLKTQKKVLQPIEPSVERLNLLNDVLIGMTAEGKAKVMGELLFLGGRRGTVVFFFDAVPVGNVLIGVG